MPEELKITCDQCGKSYRWMPELAGRRAKCKCGAAIAFPESQLEDDFGEIELDTPAVPQRQTFPMAQDLPLDYVESPSVYQPSGAMGNLGKVALSGVFSLGWGLLIGFGCGAVGAGINYAHNLSPVYIFVVPILVILLFLAAPALVGIAGGAAISQGATHGHCRNPMAILVLSSLTSIVSITTVILVANAMLADGLVGYVGYMVGGATNFEWTTKFDSVDIPAGWVYGTLAVSGLVGTLLGGFGAMKDVKDRPYCEQCGEHHERQTLWSVATNHLLLIKDALSQKDVATLQQLPASSLPNHIDVDLWSCSGEENQLVELFGQAVLPPSQDDEEPTVKDPVRVFSMAVTREQANQLKAIAARKSE